MRCVFYGDKLPNGFEEQIDFSPEMPYTISIKHFQAEDIVPLHYAETIEILLCDGLSGEIVIDANHYSLQGKQLFVIPPYTVHSNNIRPGDGIMYVFKVDFWQMDTYIHIENYLEACGCTLLQLQHLCPAYDGVLQIVRELIAHDGDPSVCLPLILSLFQLLSRYTTSVSDDAALHAQFKSSNLQELIHWTNQNYARKISIDEVANLTGYSKYHFCSRFKGLTGMTYMNYLNSVRVSHACRMLRNGDSVQAVSRNMGFENVSHFIQTFKKIQHTTPRQYALQQKKFLEESPD